MQGAALPAILANPFQMRVEGMVMGIAVQQVGNAPAFEDAGGGDVKMSAEGFAVLCPQEPQDFLWRE